MLSADRINNLQCQQATSNELFELERRKYLIAVWNHFPAQPNESKIQKCHHQKTLLNCIQAEKLQALPFSFGDTEKLFLNSFYATPDMNRKSGKVSIVKTNVAV